MLVNALSSVCTTGSGAKRNLVAKDRTTLLSSSARKNGVVEVEDGVSEQICHRLLRAGEHNGFSAILNKVGRRGEAMP